MKLFCGIDWAEAQHDLAIIDNDGQLVAKKRITDDPSGFAELIEMLTAAGDCAEDPVPVAIETPRGLLVASLRATERPVYAINPLAVARYRERHSVARSKSDHADAMTLANILRVDAHLHRRLPADSELCQAIAVLARASGRDLAAHRSTPPAAVAAARVLPDLPGRLRQPVHAGYRQPRSPSRVGDRPTPAGAAKLSVSRIAAALRRAGRSRAVDQTAIELKAGLRKPQLRQPLLVETAMGRHALALLAALDVACANVEDLDQAAAELFQTHPTTQSSRASPG